MVVLAVLLGLAANHCSGKSTRTGPSAGGGEGPGDAGEDGVGGSSAAGGKGGSGGKGASGGKGGSGATSGTGAGGTDETGGTGGRGGSEAAGEGGDDGVGGVSGSLQAGSSGASGAGAGGSAGQGGDAGQTAMAGAGQGGMGGAGQGGTGGAPSTFNPSDLGDRLVLWLDAGALAQTNGDKVAVWSDLSGAANHALQSTDAYRPTFTASSINGLPAVTFDGAQSHFQIVDTLTLRWGTGDFALLVVARGAPSEGTNAMLYQKSNLGSPYAGPNFYVNADKPSPSRRAAIQLDATTYTGTLAGVGDTIPRLFGGTRRVATGTSVLEMRVNGATESTLIGGVVDIDATAQPAIIGHNGYNPAAGFQAFAGDIAEVCAVKGTVTDEELDDLEGYLMSKYALP